MYSTLVRTSHVARRLLLSWTNVLDVVDVAYGSSYKPKQCFLVTPASSDR